MDKCCSAPEGCSKCRRGQSPSEREHTATPWVGRIRAETDEIVIVSIPKNSNIAEITMFTSTPEQPKANAEFIVKACNLHEELAAEHIAWSKNIGEAFVRAMQGDYELVDTLAKNTELVFIDGAPRLKSEALAKAETKP